MPEGTAFMFAFGAYTYNFYVAKITICCVVEYRFERPREDALTYAFILKALNMIPTSGSAQN